MEVKIFIASLKGYGVAWMVEEIGDFVVKFIPCVALFKH